ncbi:G8 domain-containing protein [Acaryochloris sp. IP29b_bin.137]|uniref:G8 domain-containing protein n=1 Tax=Acaryochloris sp. IP29b_bin.137 TaxID=2969217 RepID=UPI00260E864F|nr:G8 domain-containing protein [Acaryochloris sp. IP29b_bin.137]
MQTHQHPSSSTTHGRDSTHASPHPDQPGLHAEHSALLDLVPHAQVTHKAIHNGSWFDPNTWEGGQIPGDDAKVLIPTGLHIAYDQESTARIDTLRVDGTLQFAADQNTQLLIDTFVVAPEATLLIGTEDQPVQADITTRITFTSDQPIDTTWDPKQLSRGLVSHGQARIFGAEKLDFVALQQDPLAGDNELVLNLDGMSEPLGWQVGDQLVLGGTGYNWRGSNDDNTRFQDEVLTITAINGNRIRFTNNDILTGNNSVLRFDHQRPSGLQDQVSLYIANTTRNVVFETENADQVPIQQRGHVMFMHNADVQVLNAGFYNLGRSDKSQIVDDPGQNVDGSVGHGTNPRGRYALHFHRTGADDIHGTPALAQGNAVVGSPGWGIVHHDSHADLTDNVVFDVVGAGIVAESGNEIGTWHNNLTIKTTGDANPGHDINPKSPRTNRFDFGFNGEGYWVQGAAQVAMTDNIAISSAGPGIAFLGLDAGTESVRDAQTVAVDTLPSELRDIAKGNKDDSVVDVAAVPLRQLTGFQSYNAIEGISLWGRVQNGDGQLTVNGKPKTAHDYRSIIDNFVLWNIHNSGVLLRYSGNVDLQDGIIHARRPRATGIHVNDTALEQRYRNLHIEGFKTGIAVPYDADRDFVGSLLQDSTLINNQQHFGVTPGQLVVDNPDFSAFFQLQGNTFSAVADNLGPTAQFTSAAVGGLAVGFDATASFDSDSPYIDQASQGIVSYAWDFDGDNIVDHFGRQVRHYFDQAGSYDVTLQVWDQFGVADTLTQTIEVASTTYGNVFSNGEFSQSPEFRTGGKNHSNTANSGWFAADGVAWDAAEEGVVLSQNASRSHFGQVIYDDWIRRGIQTLSLDLRNIEGGVKPNNEITISLWGINGEFYNNSNVNDGPFQAGALPMERHELVRQTFGGENFDWTTLTWDLDFSGGYQFLVFQLNTVGTNDGDDWVVVDNVSLTGPGVFGPLPSSARIRTLPIIFRGSAIDDYAVGGFVKDKLYGGEGNDTLKGLGGDDYLGGGLGRDRLDGSEGDDTLQGHEGNDHLWGAAGDDSLHGGEGNDYLGGSWGNDILDGYLGNDSLKGHHGNDRLWGGDGNDTLHGGDGDDDLSGSFGNDRLDGANGNDYLKGHSGNDFLWGASGNDTLDGGDGDDSLVGREGNDFLWGARGNDTLNGGKGNDSLRGYDGDDFLQGASGNDTLIGGVGNDSLTGGIGVDLLIGGAGEDIFFLDILANSADNIASFSIVEDEIAFHSHSQLSLPIGQLTDQHFMLGTTATTAAHRFIYDRANGELFYDADGSGAAQQILVGTLQNKANLRADHIQIV